MTVRTRIAPLSSTVPSGLRQYLSPKNLINPREVTFAFRLQPGEPVVVDADGDGSLLWTVERSDLPSLPFFERQSGGVGIIVEGAIALLVELASALLLILAELVFIGAYLS